jgi:muramoyltetrapeptide carboxypeptidase LdcA involved in peptidoglycan recycling
MPPLRFPAPLAPGARIAVTAPSSGVPPPLQPRLDLVLAHLRALGFSVEEGQCLRDERRSASASADERAAELMRFLCRDDVDAVLPPWGGELAIELLDRLDWDALAATRPKWLIGYSDTSTLLMALTLRLGWATAHGPCLMDMAPGQPDALTPAVLPNLGRRRFEQRQSTHWQSSWTDFALVPDTTYALTEPTRWAALAHEGPLRLQGRLIGGCIDTVMHLAGTPYGDVPAFVRRAGADGALLYLENSGMSPTDWVRALHRLRWAGWLDGLAGLLVGRSNGPDTTGAHELRWAEALQSTLAGLPCPVLADLDIGHRPPQLLLVNGARATLDWSAADGGRIVQSLD